MCHVICHRLDKEDSLILCLPRLLALCGENKKEGRTEEEPEPEPEPTELYHSLIHTRRPTVVYEMEV